MDKLQFNDQRRKLQTELVIQHLLTSDVHAGPELELTDELSNLTNSLLKDHREQIKRSIDVATDCVCSPQSDVHQR